MKCFYVESDLIANYTKFGNVLTLWGWTSLFICWQSVLLFIIVYRLQQKNASTRSTSMSCKRNFHHQLPCATNKNVNNFFSNLSILSSHEQQQFKCFFREEQKSHEIQVRHRKIITRFNIEELKLLISSISYILSTQLIVLEED